MGHPHRAASDGERGVSLVEVVFYLSILAVVGIPLLMITVAMSRSSAEGNMFSTMIERNRSMLHRIELEYRNALRATTVVAPDGKSLAFTANAGCDGVGAVAGASIRYEIRLDPKESANGADDNGNGLVDESILVRVDETSGDEVVLMSALDSAKSAFAANGDGIRITLATCGKAYGSPLVASIERSVNVHARS